MIAEAAQENVKTLLREFMDAWIGKQYEELRRIDDEGFSPSGVLAPFHDALVPGIRGLGERGFSTALGNLHERIALVIAWSAVKTFSSAVMSYPCPRRHGTRRRSSPSWTPKYANGARYSWSIASHKRSSAAIRPSR